MIQADSVALRGIFWNHSRGFTPMVATAQRFHELHPHVEIAWTRRSLQEFADTPLAQLASRFDLLVIDHPCIGLAARTGALLGLSSYLPALALQAQEQESVGQSHRSYRLAGEQWALAIDAAAPVSVSRPDLLERHGGAPGKWGEMIALGRKGIVACPSIPLDVYGNFLNLCASLGSPIFPDDDTVVSRQTGVAALEMLRELAAVVPVRFFHLDPIRTLGAMSQQDAWAYCPFIYGYSNYARSGYAPRRLRFGEVVTVAPGIAAATMLGGTGLAVSTNCTHPKIAVEYARFVDGRYEREISRRKRKEQETSNGQIWQWRQIHRASIVFMRSSLSAWRHSRSGDTSGAGHDRISEWDGGGLHWSGVTERSRGVEKRT